MWTTRYLLQADVGLQNADEAKRRLKILQEWHGRRGTEVPGHACSGNLTSQRQACMWLSLVYVQVEPIALMVQECIVRQRSNFSVLLTCTWTAALSTYRSSLSSPCIECVTIVDAWRHESSRESFRWFTVSDTAGS